MVSAPATERPEAPPGQPPQDGNPFGMNVAVLVSVLIHLLALVILAMIAVLKPHRPSEVPIFEIVSLEKPKLRPLTPKVQPPPEPEPPPPEPVQEPEAPKLTPKPSKAPVPKKPEPKVVKPKEPDEPPKPVQEVVQEQQVLQPKVEMSVPADPRLSMWAGRVKKKVDNLWNPPVGLEVVGVVKAVVNFKVSRDGTITNQQIAESSGNSDLDELALMTIRRLGSVPPIPENWDGEELEVRCEFPYQGN